MARLKEKLAHTTTLSVGLCTMLAWSTTLAAQGHAAIVVLAERDGRQAGLVAALQIQLADSAEVRVRAALPGGALDERVHRAAELGRAEGALAVIWTDPAVASADGSREAVLYVVGQREGRALLEVVRVARGRGAELDRTLALKVNEVLDELRQGAVASERGSPNASMLAPPQPSAMLAPPQPSAAVPTDRSAHVSSAPDERPVWGMLGRIGALSNIALSRGWNRWGATAALGPTLDTPSLTAALEAALEFLPTARLTRDGQQITLQELTPRLAASIAWKLDGFAVGARTGVGLAWLSASGRTAQNRSGQSETRTFSWFAGVGVERAVVGGLSLSAELDLRVNALRREFDVNDETIADLGRLQLVCGLAAVFRTTSAASSR